MKSQTANCEVVDLQKYRQKKEVEAGLSRGRKPLYMSLKGKTMQGASRGISDFGDRIASIRKSFEELAESLAKTRKNPTK